MANPTEITFTIATGTGCSIVTTDTTTATYNGTTDLGFLLESDIGSPQLHVFKKSYGRFVNILYWNKYNYLNNNCDAQRLQDSYVYEDGSETLVLNTYALTRDGYFTIYRLFVLDKAVFLTQKSLYADTPNLYVYDTVTEKLQTTTWNVPGTSVNEWTEVTDINLFVLLLLGTTKITGTLTKIDFVSTCYLNTCYNGLNLLIIEQLLNPCLNSPSSFTSNTGKSLFGFSSVDCLAVYNNPNMFKRDFLFMTLSTMKALVAECDYVQAEKIIEEIVGSDTTSTCALFTYLCGDTTALNEIYSGCGCS